jgi:hypothetical protein
MAITAACFVAPTGDGDQLIRNAFYGSFRTSIECVVVEERKSFSIEETINSSSEALKFLAYLLKW